MPPGASGACHNTSQCIRGRGPTNQSSTRKHDNKNKQSTCTKCGLVYELISKKKKKKVHRCTKQRKKQIQTIRRFLVSYTLPTKSTANESESTDNSTTTITNTTSEDQDSILNNSNKASFSAQHASPTKGISCREGDK
eukprot:7450372-Ditylum_brightwellii.AAC.1